MIDAFQPGSQMTAGPKPWMTIEAQKAMTRSITANWYSEKPPRRSSK